MSNNKIKFILLILMLVLGNTFMVSKNNSDMFKKINIVSGAQHLTHKNNSVAPTGFNTISDKSPHLYSPELIDKKERRNKVVSTRSASDVTENSPVIDTLDIKHGAAISNYSAPILNFESAELPEPDVIPDSPVFETPDIRLPPEPEPISYIRIS